MDKRFVRQTYWQIKWHDFDALVTENFPQYADFEFLVETECNNDSYHGYRSVLYPPRYTHKDTGEVVIIDFEKADIDAILNGERSMFATIHNILAALVAKGVIEEGNYLIEVSY